ncbi:HIT family protein [Lihuaxuella thermophila]|uniref:Diadenosine tetraphosphate (Ap4A) hydrolase n=1 Tax=Lihuaxuella thermophila TaxID=1173111 RepID=A0A1H8CDN2_9BACL|nr:HIT family protein [Lihuaxuella thermophila]SEM93371.1 Diadenosine tetraphosphate (Ap4A) hydrolase [Lihuaxuella thermophila]
MSCVFCSQPNKILENDLAFAIYDKYPVNQGHMLIIPKRHVSDYFDLTVMEKQAVDRLLAAARNHLEKHYQPDGYNVGINCGKAAGQTIFHVHVHLIPRYVGDLNDPRGGVRGVIPDKRIY